MSFNDDEEIVSDPDASTGSTTFFIYICFVICSVNLFFVYVVCKFILIYSLFRS